LRIIDDIILSTKDHAPLNYQAKMVIDLDLMNLTETWARYKEIVRKSKQEYLRFLGERGPSQFIKIRKDFVEKYLAKDKLFHSDFFLKSAATDNARRNLETELIYLNKGRNYF